MDHYKILGVQRNASKEEIKQAFRSLAMQFHPDKHADSPKHLRDTATAKFKQLSEAYEILTDDRKRADYNISASSWNTGCNQNHGYAKNYGYGYGGNYTHDYMASRGKRAGPSLQFELLFRFLNARTFVRTATIAGVLIGAIYLIDDGVDALWNTKNSGVNGMGFVAPEGNIHSNVPFAFVNLMNPQKSLEDALESIKEAKAVKDKS
ncbi:chaperone protein dnaJ 72-like isoform X2 [Coffea eugenioides]|uniref:Chaperone protein dnaJ 72-like isoform X1 n=1 Tax=Coffea arabica TaxID=13443 RepID=A0A6P6SG96_COFAR|nr:chaperone protein dnaJ 72-like isoform X2 [Coffea eugenioides]